MKDAISPKLQALLALTIVIAGVGAWRLLTVSGTPIDTGFDSATELPIVVAPMPESSDPVVEPVAGIGRNPFSRADGGETFVASTVEVDSAGSIGAPSPGAGANEPAFPDPDLAARGPQNGDAAVDDAAASDDPGADTSFEG